MALVPGQCEWKIQLSQQCLQTILGTPATSCPVNAWTIEALQQALQRQQQKRHLISDSKLSTGEALIERLSLRGVIIRRAIRLDNRQQLDLCWLSPPRNVELPLVTSSGEASNSSNMPPATEPLQPVTPPPVKRRRLGNVNKPFRSPLARPPVAAGQPSAIAADTTQKTPSATSPTPRAARSQANLQSTGNIGTLDPERRTLLVEKRSLEAELDRLQTLQRRQRMMLAFKSKNQQRSITASIDKWREVCQEVVEQIRSRIDPHTFREALAYRPEPPPWATPALPCAGSTSADGSFRAAHAHGHEDKESEEPEQLTYRSMLKLLGVTDLRLLQYSDEDDCFY